MRTLQSYIIIVIITIIAELTSFWITHLLKSVNKTLQKRKENDNCTF